ncbi:hypothetical protein AMTRI_Chr02g218330 [Amborella trichopoda]
MLIAIFFFSSFSTQSISSITAVSPFLVFLCFPYKVSHLSLQFLFIFAFIFFIVLEKPSLHTQISVIMITHTFDSQRFLYAICSGLPLTRGLVRTKNPRILHPMVAKGLNVPQNLGFYILRFFSATFMKAPMPMQYEPTIEYYRLADLSVYMCVKVTTTSLFSY